MKQNKGQVDGKWNWEDYLPVPAALSIDIHTSLEQQAAAIVGWKAKIGKDGFSGSGAGSLESFLLEKSKELGKRKLVMFTADLNISFHFLKRSVSSYFDVNKSGVASAIIGSIELRDPKYVFDDWELCSEAELEVEQLKDFAEFYWMCIVNKNSVPLTTQQVVKKMMKSRMTAADKLLVYSLAPYSRETYDYIMKHLYIGAYCDAIIKEPLEEAIGHVDFTTSYIARMLTDYFPMTPFVEYPIDKLEEALHTKCCQIEATLYDVESTSIRFIAKKRAVAYEDVETDGVGRIKKAKMLKVCLTELDFDLLRKLYNFSSITIDALYVADRGELPEYVRSVAEELYAEKATSPKKSLQRKWAKIRTEMVYGCSVKAIYSEEGESWHSIKQNKMFMSPYWGIWCVAHARHALLMTAMMLGDDFIYADTDSLYFRNPLFHIGTIDSYNQAQEDKIYRYCHEHSLDFNIYKDLGKFSYEDDSTPQHPTIVRFTGLGPKRYIYTVKQHEQREVVVKIAGFAKQYERDGQLLNAWEYYFTEEEDLYSHFSDDFKIVDVQRVVEPHDDEFCKLFYKGKMYVSDSYALVYYRKTHTSVKDRFIEAAEANCILQGKQYEAGKEERVQVF